MAWLIYLSTEILSWTEIKFGGEHNRWLKFIPELHMMLASGHRQLIFHLRSCDVKLRTSRVCLLVFATNKS
jgi:hypothetical protein